MDLHINDALKDPILVEGIIAAAEEKNGGPLKGILPHPEEIEVTTTAKEGDELVTIDMPPGDPDEPVIIPFNQPVEESFVPAEGAENLSIEDFPGKSEDEEAVIEQTFAPADVKARTRLSDMVVQLSASLRLRAAEAGFSIENAYSERKLKIQESSDLDDKAKSLSLALLDHAYSAAATQGPIDKEDKETMGALNMLAHGLIKASEAGNIKARLSTKKTKSVRTKKVQARRDKNKMAKQTRKKQRRKK